MDAHRLRCFVMVVETGNLSKAAAKLYMTQPPLSMLIRKLEAELGVQLFDRVNNRLVLTATGHLFYRRAKELLASMQALARELKESSHGLRGTVAVGCSTAASLFIIPKVMEQIQAQGLNITVRVHEGETVHLVEKLRDQQLDVGICRSEYRAADLHTVNLYTEPLLLALPTGHPLLKKRNIRLEDLKDERFLMHTSPVGRGIADVLIESCQLSGFSPQVVYWGIETLPMLLMVEQGLGIAFAPKSFAQLRAASLPRFVEIAHPKLETSLSLITQKNRIQSAATQRFLSITAQVLDSLRAPAPAAHGASRQDAPASSPDTRTATR
jgi:DNA-binding transcriptional LysR family regulator